jgi:hypothetical protein
MSKSNRFFLPILKSTVLNNGTSTNKQVWEDVFNSTKNILTLEDIKVTTKGEPKFQTIVRNAKQSLVKKGYLENVRSNYILTSLGREYYNSLTRV